VITRKSKIIFSAITLLVLAGAIGVGAYHVFAVATNQAGVGYGAIGMDSSFNVSVGSSSPAGIARFVVNASSGASTYTLKALSSTGASLFSVDNSGNVVTAGSLTAGSFVGNLSGTDAAGNISSGAFGANTGGGNYSFPASVGIGTASPASQLMVYGSAGTGAPVTGGGTLLVGDSALGSTNAGGAVLFGGGNSSGQYFAGIKGALQNGSGNASGNLNFYTRVNATDGSLTQQMTILSSGNVGIGTTGPGYKLDVEGGQVNASGGFCIAGSCIASWPTGNVTSVFGRTGAVTAASGDYTVAQVTGAAPLASPTFTGSVTMPGGIWNSSGNVGIGTTAPGQKLEVNGNASIDGDLYVSSPGGFWLSGKTGTNGITAASAQTASSYTPILRQTTASGNVVALGGLGDSFGFTTYNSARTTNGVDYYPLWFSTSNGNVGIEQSSPAYTLDVAGQIRSSSGGYVFPDGTTQTTAASGSTVVTAGNVSAGTFGSNTGGGNYAFSGNVGIGTSGPVQKLSVAGEITANEGTWGSGGYSFIQDGSQDTGMFSPSDGVIDFYDNQVHSINISAAGNATFYAGPYTNDWFRVNGSGGIVWQSYGGGWYMQDTTWIRSYGSKPVYMSNGFDSGAASGVNCGGGLGNGYTFDVCGTANVASNLTVAGNLSVSNKITATTFDPVYTIGGTNYATYLPGMTGVKEETAGTLDLQRNSDGSYSFTINFASEPTGGDLWLFAKATDMPGAMSQLVVSLTPSFSGNVWYEKNAALGTLTIHGSAAGEVSYNLTAPRFDASQWTNIGDPNAKGLLVK
jgi:hypothetical protein